MIVLGIMAYCSPVLFETEGLNEMRNLSRTETLTALRNMFDREYNFTELYRWEHEKVEFVEKRDFEPSSDPLEILQIGKGRCGEFSALYVALCLAHGYQSRLVTSVDVSYRVLWFPQHAWAEIKLGDTWVHVDPSDQVWNQTAHYKGWWRGPCIRIYAFEEGKVTDVTQYYEINTQTSTGAITLTLSKTLQSLGLVLDFFGALIFAIPLLKSEREIEAESGTYWDYNPALRKTMKRDRKLARIGLVIIMIGFALQAFAILI